VDRDAATVARATRGVGWRLNRCPVAAGDYGHPFSDATTLRRERLPFFRLCSHGSRRCSRRTGRRESHRRRGRWSRSSTGGVRSSTSRTARSTSGPVAAANPAAGAVGPQRPVLEGAKADGV